MLKNYKGDDEQKYERCTERLPAYYWGIEKAATFGRKRHSCMDICIIIIISWMNLLSVQTPQIKRVLISSLWTSTYLKHVNCVISLRIALLNVRYVILLTNNEVIFFVLLCCFASKIYAPFSMVTRSTSKICGYLKHSLNFYHFCSNFGFLCIPLNQVIVIKSLAFFTAGWHHS